MKEFQNIGKQMPYKESEAYLNQLISQSTENAISQAPKRTATIRRMRYIAAAAAVALLVTIGVTQCTGTSEPQMAQTEQAGPLDEFLNSLSDEEAQLLAYYDIEEIPEYE